MEIVITGRHTDVSDRFREMTQEKLAKVAQLAPKAHRADVELSHERNPRQSAKAEKVEITLRGKGPVVRAEARAEEAAAALDLALGKLLERLRRTGDRRKVHRGKQRKSATLRHPDSLALVGIGVVALSGEPAQVDEVEPDVESDSPLMIRDKDHIAAPMTVEQALYEMEMVGHDFFLFEDSESNLPSVVYRRHGWNYGVMRLKTTEAADSQT